MLLAIKSVEFNLIVKRNLVKIPGKIDYTQENIHCAIRKGIITRFAIIKRI